MAWTQHSYWRLETAQWLGPEFVSQYPYLAATISCNYSSRRSDASFLSEHPAHICMHPSIHRYSIKMETNL